MPDPFDFYLSSAVVANGAVYFGSGDGNVYALDAANGSLKWKFHTGNVVHASPALAVTLNAPGGDVELVLAHPMSPIGAEFIARRNEQVAALARHASAAQRPLVLAGDLNLTMWNAAYRPLEDLAKLRNARQGHGIEPTWPALGPVGVPIDHVLGSRGVHLRNFRVLPGIGSDHFPVIAEFSAR
jgi:endonuclease/exonuclease/phosphatase (EEP) superfamily protein YafD